jgi:hypothetical protein
MNSSCKQILSITLKNHWESVTLSLILIVALAVRVYGIGFGLPYVGYYADEYFVSDPALEMIQRGDWKPSIRVSFSVHVQFLVGQMAFLYRSWRGMPISPEEVTPPRLFNALPTMGVGLPTNFPEFYLWGRLAVALIGTLTILVVYIFGKGVASREAGLLAAAFLTFSPIHARFSHFPARAVPGTFLILLATCMIILAYKRDKWWLYLLALPIALLAIYAKQNGRIVLVPLFLAPVLGLWKNRARIGIEHVTTRVKIALAAVLLLILFLLLISDKQIISSLVSFFDFLVSPIWNHPFVYAPAPPSAIETKNTWLWIIRTFARDWKCIFPLAVCGLVWVVLSRKRDEGLLLISTPLAYYLVVTSFTVMPPRWMVPMIPFLALVAGIFVADAKALLVSRLDSANKRGVIFFIVFLSLIVMVEPAMAVLETDYWLTQKDVQTLATEWIQQNIPVGAKFLVECYGPYLPEEYYKVEYEWYLTPDVGAGRWQDFDYLVFSEACYGRFYADPHKCAEQVSQYDALFREFTLVKEIVGPNLGRPDYTIKIYDTRPPLLSLADLEGIPHRSSIYYEGKVELIGYELSSEEIQPGETLWVTLYWRALRKMERDYTVSVKLWGRDDQIIGHEGMHPGWGTYPTSRWQPGDVFADTYGVTISGAALAPSLCRIEVVLHDRETMKHLTAYDKNRNRIDDAFITHIKLSPVEPLQFLGADTERYNLGNKIALIGYGLDKRAIKPGDRLHLTLYWEALEDMSEDYTVFTHLVDARNHIWGQKDSQPLNGYYPTTLWEMGEIVEDEYHLTVQPDAQAGEYWIEVGMYVLSTGERLPLVDDKGERLDDKIVIEEVNIH